MTEPQPRAPRARSSRARFLQFLADYRSRRLDNTLDESVPGADAKPAAEAKPTRRRQYLREYVRWLRPHAWGVGLLFLLALAIAGLQMVEPLFIRYRMVQRQAAGAEPGAEALFE